MSFLFQLGESFRFHALILLGMFHPKGGEVVMGIFLSFMEIQLGGARD